MQSSISFNKHLGRAEQIAEATKPAPPDKARVQNQSDAKVTCTPVPWRLGVFITKLYTKLFDFERLH